MSRTEQIILVAKKAEAIRDIKTKTTAYDSVLIDGIIYNGGDDSASAITGAIQLAQSLGEAEVKLWDIDNTIRTYTFEEAQAIAAQIAKAYRDAKYSDYAKVDAINACSTIAELASALGSL